MPDVPDDLHAQTDREYGPCAEHAAELRAVKVYPVGERPDVLVEVDGDWCTGELRMWLQGPTGWWAQCTWRRIAGETFIDTFPAERIREDEETRA